MTVLPAPDVPGLAYFAPPPRETLDAARPTPPAMSPKATQSQIAAQVLATMYGYYAAEV